MAGKLANISGDMPRMEKVEEGILKQLTSGDSLQVNRKHKDPITMIPTAKLIFATNELPPINDRSEGIWRRMIAVPFLKQFSPEQRDTHRAENLMIELPGIFNWAMAGAKRLYQQERFTVCPMCAACVDEHRIHSDAFQQFVQEEVVLQKDASILTNSLYESYKKFCEKNGRKARNSSDFGRQVRSLPGVTKERQSYGQRPYEYRGMTCGSLTPRFGSPERINDSTNSSNP
jgi:putative DNA primase/helicase